MFFRSISLILMVLLTTSWTKPVLAEQSEIKSCGPFNSSVLGNQHNRLCQMVCAANMMASPKARIPETAECKSTRELLEDRSLHEKGLSFLGSCLSGAASAAIENIIDTLAPEDHRRFMKACQYDVECRRGLARKLDQYRSRGTDGKYLKSDADVDKEIATVDLNTLWTRSRFNQGVTHDACQRELGKITKNLSFTFASSDRYTEFEVRKQRYADLVAFDADCPALLKMEVPRLEGTKLDPGKVLTDLRAPFLSSSQDIAGGVERWFEDIGIAYQCYDEKVQGELLCYGVAKVLFDPVNLATGGALATKALAVAKVNRTIAAERALRFSNRVESNAKKYRTTKMMEIYRYEENGESTMGSRWMVKYLTPEERARKRLYIQDGLLYSADGKLFNAKDAIYVMDDAGRFYASTEHRVGRFHHSSFLGGEPVAAAGELVVEDGRIISISRSSGHYRPDRSFLDQALAELRAQGVDLSRTATIDFSWDAR